MTAERHDAEKSVDPADAPAVGYWHLWVDNDGVTRQARCHLKAFEKKTFAPPSPDMWVKRLTDNVDDITVLVLQAGWTGDWHRNPRPQWIVPLSGSWFVESMDGTRVEMGPGEASFGEDQLARPDAEGREGHLSGTIGEAPCVLMLVQVSDPPGSGNPCMD